ncbi:MAG: hypothetical protein J6Z45_02820 [Oscillospiraceae bacterium]|nr:hypothetical protein [Oscillospiraceae bacterium]
MYCRHCRSMIPDGSDFCPTCGGAQNDAAPAPGGYSSADFTSANPVARIPKRLIAKIALAIALVCFALPFMAVSCSNGSTTMFEQQYSGFQLMTSIGGDSDTADESVAEKEKDAKPNIYAIISFALGAAALILLVIGKRSKLCGVFSGISALALVAVAATFRSYYGLDSLNTGGSDSLLGSANMSDMISVDVKFGLIIAVILFICAALCCFLDTENP